MKFLTKIYLPEFVYGSVDGIVTTVAVITGSIGIGLPTHIIFILGLANVFADGFSMGSSKFLSSISHNQITMTEGINKSPKSEGFATFISFIFIGFIPLVPFLISILIPSFKGLDIIFSLSFSIFSFILVGYIGASVTGTSHFRNIIRTVIVGSIAASISFCVGYLLNNMM